MCTRVNLDEGAQTIWPNGGVHIGPVAGTIATFS